MILEVISRENVILTLAPISGVLELWVCEMLPNLMEFVIGKYIFIVKKMR
jgi:hypothetical protein